MSRKKIRINFTGEMLNHLLLGETEAKRNELVGVEFDLCRNIYRFIFHSSIEGLRETPEGGDVLQLTIEEGENIGERKLVIPDGLISKE